jgi:hypothetical protein
VDECPAFGLEQRVHLPQVAVLRVQVEVKKHVECVREREATLETGRERRFLDQDEPHVRVPGQGLSGATEHPLRDVEAPEFTHARGDAGGDPATTDPDLGDGRVRAEIGEQEVLEDAVDVLGRSPLVSEEANVPLAPCGCLRAREVDVEVGLVLAPVTGVRVPESPVPFLVPEPRQDEAVEVQLADAAHEVRGRILTAIALPRSAEMW